MISMIEPPIMEIIKAFKAPRPPPPGGGLDLLAALDITNGAHGRGVPNRS